jgi:phosphohistidine phosphatase
MKTLLLMRHAKSSWKEKETNDHERVLNKRGRKDAPRMGTLLQERELSPQIILSSSALRARQTAELVAEAAGFPGEPVYLDNLYMAEADEYISVLRGLSDDYERVLVVGHNPGLETLLQILSHRIESLPTAVIAHLVIDIDHWSALTKDMEGDLIEIWRPKELTEEDQEIEKPKAKEKEKEKGKEKEKPRKKKN